MVHEASSWRLPCFTMGFFEPEHSHQRVFLAPEHFHWVPKWEGMNGKKKNVYLLCGTENKHLPGE